MGHKTLVSIVWDDALVTDLRIIDLIRKLGVTSAFAISPMRHGDSRRSNDIRDSIFGKIVSRSELKEFSDFEVFNHTARHKELTKIRPEFVSVEISDGKKALEDLFGREIAGFCYPYGSHDKNVMSAVKACGHAYARTSKVVGGRVSFKDLFAIGTSERWFNLGKITMQSGPFIFWGHSYEVSNWLELEHFYRFLKDNFKIVSFQELVRRSSWKKF